MLANPAISYCSVMALNIGVLLPLMLFISTLHVNIAAGSDGYLCTIERLSLANGDVGDVYEFYKKSSVGKKFTVERASGLMAGFLKNSYVKKPQVIDYGSKDNSYKVITTMRAAQGAGAGSNIYALTVVEYEEGPKKPFVFLTNSTVYFGRCEHF